MESRQGRWARSETPHHAQKISTALRVTVTMTKVEKCHLIWNVRKER